MEETTLTHITDQIYAYPGTMMLTRPWVGVIPTDEGTVLVDSGNGPLQAGEIRAALERMGAAPVSHILLTHHHWDHVFGSCAFPGAHIVAQEGTQHHLEVMAGEPWSREYVEAKGASFPRGKIVSWHMNRAVPDWASFRAVPATETFQDRYELVLGGYHFLMEHVGGQHEPDQCLVHVQPGNVLFLGDAAYGHPSSTEAWDREALAGTLRGFMERYDAEWYVEGHRTPADRDRFAERIERLRAGT